MKRVFEVETDGVYFHGDDSEQAGRKLIAVLELLGPGVKYASIKHTMKNDHRTVVCRNLAAHELGVACEPEDSSPTNFEQRVGSQWKHSTTTKGFS